MKELLVGRWSHLFILVLAVLLTACPAKTPSNDGKNIGSSNIDGGKQQQQGGYDWGGGEVIRSSPSLVKRTIELAQTNANEQAVEKSIFRQFLIWSIANTSSSQRFNTAILFPGSGDGLKEDVVRLTDSPALAAISRKKLKLLETGDCPRSKNERTADASVSMHTLDAEVCFSIGNLSKVSPSDLTRQVMGLMLHEAVHMAGGDEDNR